METIITRDLTRKRGGTVLAKAEYEVVKDFIISTLKTKRNVSLNYLLEQAEKNIAKVLRGNTAWYIIKVKSDLESKKIIQVKIEHTPTFKQTIVLNKRAINKMNKLSVV